ncbi:MAG: hypothetical protein IPH08_00700 [Rhodocyclaceae bacterium]|jgi:hypothetical protein|nr:hypothetical protein [Rhodocyclaceae bacterium]
MFECLSGAFNRGVLLAVTVLASVFATGQAHAQGALDAAEAQFAEVLRLRGEVRAGANDKERVLRTGDQVRVGERIVAAPSGEAVLRTVDAGMVAVRPGTEFIVQGYTARGGADDGMVLRLVTGSLRVISGWIARTNRGGHKIVTPSATIGIRGTDHEPYVLTADRPTSEGATPHRAGTYDKVNRGGTTLVSGGEGVDIDPGRVGFVRGEAKAYRTRAIMTLLLPVLLDKIPDFYVPGAFDTELDAYSATADELARRELETRAVPVAQAQIVPPVAVPTPMPAVAKANTPAAPEPLSPGEPARGSRDCDAMVIATQWLTELDDGIVRKDPNAILSRFADEVAIKAVIRKTDGTLAEIDFTRDELVRSTISTMNQLEDYSHRRVSVEASPEVSTAGACQRLMVKSVVLEGGKLAGKPYRFDSVEEYLLERRDGRWLAVRSRSTQR